MANRTSGTSSGGGNPTVLSSSGVGHQIGSGSTLDAGAAANVYTNLRNNGSSSQGSRPSSMLLNDSGFVRYLIKIIYTYVLSLAYLSNFVLHTAYFLRPNLMFTL